MGISLLTIALALSTCAYAACVIFGIRQFRPGLVLSFVFFLVYLLIRPGMLLSGLYGRFALLHPFPSKWTPADIWPVLLFTIGITGAFGFAYFLARPGAVAQRLVRLLTASSVSRRAAGFITLIALLAYILGTVLLIAVLQYFSYGFLMFAVCVVLHQSSHGKLNWPAIIGASAFAVVLMLLTGERRDWAVGMFAIGWALVFLRRTKIVTKIAMGIALLGALAYVAIALRTIGSAIERIESAGQSTAMVSIVEWELDFPLVYDDLVLLFKRVPEKKDYLYGESLVKPFLSWIPRDLWPTKPETFSRQVSHAFNPSFYRAGGSEPLTFVGELYWNFGWLGIPFGALLGYMLALFDAVYQSGRVLRLVSPNAGHTVMAGGLLLNAMTFYVFRGPIDTVWLSYAGFFTCLISCVALRRIA